MLSNQITVTDGTTPITLDLISRTGMKSVRVNMSADSSVAEKMTLDSTLPSSASGKARHVAILNFYDEDSETGEIFSSQVHMVISRDQRFPDASIEAQVAYLANLITQTDFVNQLVHGGN